MVKFVGFGGNNGDVIAVPVMGRRRVAVAGGNAFVFPIIPSREKPNRGGKAGRTNGFPLALQRSEAAPWKSDHVPASRSRLCRAVAAMAASPSAVLIWLRPRTMSPAA
jgi:hypothetical protein